MLFIWNECNNLHRTKMVKNGKHKKIDLKRDAIVSSNPINQVIILILPILLLITSCQKEEPKYETYMGVKYAVCGDFYDQTVYIKNLGDLSESEILSFSYCFSLSNHFRGLRIVNEHYFAESIISGKSGTFPLYQIELQDSVVQISNSEVATYRIIDKFHKKAQKSGLEEVANGEYEIRYSCE